MCVVVLTVPELHLLSYHLTRLCVKHFLLLERRTEPIKTQSQLDRSISGLMSTLLELVKSITSFNSRLAGTLRQLIPGWQQSIQTAILLAGTLPTSTSYSCNGSAVSSDLIK